MTGCVGNLFPILQYLGLFYMVHKIGKRSLAWLYHRICHSIFIYAEKLASVALTFILREIFLAQTYEVRRHFNKFIVLNEIDGLFKSKGSRWC